MVDQPENTDASDADSSESVAGAAIDEPSNGSHAANRAAGIAWAVGLIEIIFATVMAAFLFWAANQSLDDLYRSYFHESLAYRDWLLIHPKLTGFAIAVILLGVLPGVVYLVAGYSLKHSVAKAAMFVATLAILQSFVLTGLLVMRLGHAFGKADPAAMSMSVLAIGTPIAVLLYTARCSWTVWRLRYRS